MEQPPDINLSDPAFEANPYPTYARLREEAPVCRVRLPDGRPAWLVTRYDDIAAVLHDHNRFSSRAMLSQVGKLPALPPRAQDVMSLFSLIMSSNDPPDHTRLRALVERAFAPRLIAGLKPYVERLAGELLDAVEARARARGERTMDLVADYAFPLPAAVIMKFIGVPAEGRDDIRRWSESLLKFDRSPESAVALAPELSAFIDYVRSLLDAKRKSPADDLLSGLVRQEQGDRLTEMELVSLTFQLIFAGHSTTSHLIGNAVLALLTNPGQLEKLRAEPALVKGAVDEVLRYDAPQQMRARLATADTEIGGVCVRKGEVVLVAFGSGNRDRAHFEAPDELDITRGDSRHLSFGKGIHGCFGVPLARLEAETALAALFRRMPGLRLAVAPDRLRRVPGGLHMRGLASLPLTF